MAYKDGVSLCHVASLTLYPGVCGVCVRFPGPDMHELTLIHTDLKPENILLLSSEYIKVPDYKVLFMLMQCQLCTVTITLECSSNEHSNALHICTPCARMCASL